MTDSSNTATPAIIKSSQILGNQIPKLSLLSSSCVASAFRIRVCADSMSFPGIPNSMSEAAGNMNTNKNVPLSYARSRRCRNKTVNIGGLIVEYSCPKMSKGTDYYCHIKIVDDSYNQPGLPVNIFEYAVEKLPLFVSPGDIILLSDVQMEGYDNEPWAVYKKMFSGFALYRRTNSQNVDSCQVSAGFSAKEDDNQLVTRLINWFVRFKLSEDSRKFRTFSNIVEKREGHVNLLCKVLHTCETADGSWVFLWDGTDAPPNRIDTGLESEKDEPLPLHFGDMALPREILCTFPQVGTVLRAFIHRDVWKHISLWIKGRAWAKFMHVQCTVRGGLWIVEITTDSSTKFRYTTEEEIMVQDRERKYEDRLLEKSGKMPTTCVPHLSQITALLPEVDHDGIRFSTLMNVLTCEEVPAKFKCIVRFVALLQTQNSASSSPQSCHSFRFTVEDPTARLHVYTHGENQVLFFGNDVLADIMQKKDKLLGVDTKGGVGRNPPWVKCCLKSFYTNKNDQWGSRVYMIFNTQLL